MFLGSNQTLTGHHQGCPADLFAGGLTELLQRLHSKGSVLSYGLSFTHAQTSTLSGIGFKVDFLIIDYQSF